MPKPYMLYPVYTSETIPVKKEIFEQLTDDIIDRIKEICTEHHSNGILVDKVGLAYEVPTYNVDISDSRVRSL